LYTYQDLAGHNCFGPIIQDEVLLAEDIVTYVGQPVVVVAAESRSAIQKAKAAIRLVIEELPPVLDIETAIEKGQFIGETRTIETGDVEKAFCQAPYVLEGVFHSGGQEHFYLESQTSIAYPGEYNTLTVYTSTQNPSEVQAVIAEVLGLNFNQVICIIKRMGGAFGGKECQATQPAAMASLVALKTKRPARIHLSVDDDMKSTGKRHAFQNQYRVAFTEDGLITALETHLFSDGGAANDLSTAVMGRAMCHAENAYYIPNVKITGTVCRTNFPPNTAFRGFGGPQGMANMENIIETIAQFLKKDAYEIRRLNCYGVTDRNVTPYGEVVQNNQLPELFDRLHEGADYQNRMAALQAFNAQSQTHLKGMALTPVKFGISFNTKFLNQANALVNIYLDGTVQVSTGATEMGQGVNTKIQQLVADEFQIPAEWVRVMPTSTEKNNNTSATAASSASDLNGGAAVDACRKIRQRLVEFAERHLSVNSICWDESGLYDPLAPEQKLSFKALVDLAYHERISLGERGFFATPGLHWDWSTGKGNPFLYYTTGCAVSEVLIDRFTGDLKVTRADLLLDIGKSMNPGIDRGQIVGAFIQGMGWVTMEALRYSDKGELLTHSPTTYKIPNIQDVPEIFNIDWIENDENTANLRGSKAVGEPPLMLALSVWVAVKHALSFVSGGEIVEVDLPATNEEILSRLTFYSGAKTNLNAGQNAGLS
jgi:xanthine dehydrogenase large subunit